MKYKLSIEGRAKKDLQALDQVTQKRIAKKLKYFLAQEDPLIFAKKLTDPNDANYRWRIGHYRVVFDLRGKTIKMLRVQHRREVYRK